MEVKRNNSKKRQAILDALRATREHPTADTLYSQLKPEYPELSLGTVYRNLSVLLEDGLIISVGKVDGQERYDATVTPHAHFICRSCNRVIDLDLPNALDGLYGELDELIGCRAESVSLSVNGLCNACINN